MENTIQAVSCARILQNFIFKLVKIVINPFDSDFSWWLYAPSMHIPEGSCAAEKTNIYSIISDTFRKYSVQKGFLNAALYEKYLTTKMDFLVHFLTSAQKRNSNDKKVKSSLDSFPPEFKTVTNYVHAKHFPK